MAVPRPLPRSLTRAATTDVARQVA